MSKRTSAAANNNDTGLARLWLRSICLAAVLASLAFYALRYIETERSREVSATLQTARETLLAEDVRRKRAELEHFFTLAYQTARTASLLPSVRAIQGANRASESDDMVAKGRFTKEGRRTIQQLYNNLADNVAVSEVYLTLAGLQPGQFPFLMYDEIILQAANQSGGEKGLNTDFPPEVEDEEYAYLPMQIASLKASHPHFGFQNLNDIPAVSSPAMRTCDNTQYVSQATGDPVHASGVIYSVPFYGDDNALRGIVSTVFRINVLEAMLVDMPFLIVTEQDRERAAKLKLEMPKKFGNFVLVNEGQGLFIGDRRDASLVRGARQALTGGVTDSYHVVPLDIRDATPWKLVYRYDLAQLAAEVAPIEERWRLWRMMLQGGAVLIFLWLIYDWRKRAQILAAARAIEQFAGGDLRQHLTQSGRGELGILLKSLKMMSTHLHGVISEVRLVTDHVAGSASEIAKGGEGLAQTTQEQMLTIGDMSNRMTAIRQQAAASADASLASVALAQAALQSAQTGNAVMQQAAVAMGRIEDVSHQIAKVTQVMDAIAGQINLLSLNASIEAARAGAAGRGFAVVAQEVRKLAVRSAESAEEISVFVADSVREVTLGAQLVHEAASGLEIIGQQAVEVERRANEIASSQQEQALVMAEIENSAKELSRATEQNAAFVEELASSSESMRDEAQGLSKKMGYFRLS